MTPTRGEVWLFDLGMEGKVRPALIVSVASGDLDWALVTLSAPYNKREGFSV
jgi:mRNA-degrading endonuclease toxin of MazEF toxin-antitoxin module